MAARASFRAWPMAGVALLSLTAAAASEDTKSAKFGAGVVDPGNHADAAAAIEVRVVLNQPAFLSAWVEYYTSTCALDSSGTWTIDKAPKKGTWTTSTLNGQLGNGNCPGTDFPFNALYYTWTTAGAANGATDHLTATWSTPDGATERESFLLVLASLLITSPLKNESFMLDQSNYAQAEVSFTAQAADTSTAIDWSTTLSYQTSGHRGHFSSKFDFKTQPEGTKKHSYAGMGGQIIATAAQGAETDKVAATVAGAAIPGASFTSLLGSLYASGATPALLEQIATYESSYAQFTNRTLYKVSALWPTESYDGGSHIGLMQVATKTGFGVAFDYTRNAEAGATLFKGNIGIATKRLNALRLAHKRLTKPTGVMIEDEALSYYNVGTGPRYWIVTFDSTGHPQWTENTSGNPQGTGYADCVRTQTVGTRTSC